MAILNKIRQQTVFLILIIALALFSFVLMDVISNGGFGAQNRANTIATVNGVDIDRNQFANQVDGTIRQMGGNMSNMQAVDLVWNRIVNATLLENKADELGIVISEQQKIDAIGQTLSQDFRFVNESGMFDYNKYTEYLADVKANNPLEHAQFLQFENQVEQSLKQDAYLNMVNAGLKNASNAEGEFEYKLQSDQVNIQYVQIPYTNIPDEEISVSEEEILSFIKRNPKKYEVEAAVDIQYVYFSEDPSADDENAVKEEVAKLVNQQLLYNAATKQNDTLAGFAETTDYVEFLSQFSDIPYNDRWVFKNQLPEEIADTIFNTSVGEIYGPFKFQNNYGLAKVIETKQMHDSVHAKHILISWTELQNADVNRTKEEAKTLADSLMVEIKKDITKFDDLATHFSNDPSAATNKGDLGFLSPYGTVDAFDEFIFGNKTGDIAVVETDFGYHIVSIEEQKNLQKAIKAPIVLRAIEPSEVTTDEVFNKTTTFEAKAGDTDFVEAAKEGNYMVSPVNGIKMLDENIPGLGNNRKIVTWAFDKKTKVGDISRYPVSNGSVVVQVTAKREKGLMPAYEASALVSPLVRNEKKAQKIKAEISGNTLEEIASQNNTTVKTANTLTLKNPTIADIGNEPKVIGAAFGLAEGATSQLIDGNSGVFKVKVVKKNLASSMQDYSTYSTQVQSRRNSNVQTRILGALKSNAEIKDHRADFY